MRHDASVAEPDTLLDELTRVLESRPASFGRYQVIEEVGEGAMSRVYKAFDPVTQRPVAIKVLRPAPWFVAQGEECRRRFHREAEAAGGLSHPNIVVIYDVDHEYFVMEFLHGRTLRALLDQYGQLTLTEALPILQGMAEALDYAHRKGIIHRDVKPGNIMVLPDGHPKVMDFGVAHFVSGGSTAPGQCLGSPLYMAPEQVRGEAVTAQSDVFALASVAYEMLTGQKAFGAPTLPAILRRVVEDTPTPPSQLVAGLPERCDAALARGFAKNVTDRFATAAELVEGLRGDAGDRRAPRRSPRAAAARRPVSSKVGDMETQDLRLLDLGTGPGMLRPPRPSRWMPAKGRGRASTVAFALLLAVPLVSSTWVPPAPVRAQPSLPPLVSVPVRSEPPGAIVWIDGRPAGRTPFVLENVSPGLHHVKLAQHGFVPIELQLAFDAHDRAPLAFRLQPLPEPPAPVLRVVRVVAPSAVREGDMVALGRGVTEPKRLSGRLPSYPTRAYPAQGVVKLELTVTENGEAVDITVVDSPHALLAREMTETVKTWRFDPARKDGIRVRVRWPVEQRFTVAKR